MFVVNPSVTGQLQNDSMLISSEMLQVAVPTCCSFNNFILLRYMLFFSKLLIISCLKFKNFSVDFLTIGSCIVIRTVHLLRRGWVGWDGWEATCVEGAGAVGGWDVGRV